MAAMSGLYPWKFNKNLLRRPFHDSIDSGDNLVYQVRARPSSAMMKNLAMVASSPLEDATVTWYLMMYWAGSMLVTPQVSISCYVGRFILISDAE
jgi:hypothetical protein